MDFEYWLKTDNYESYICKRYLDTVDSAKGKSILETVYKEGYKQGIIEARNLVIEYISDN